MAGRIPQSFIDDLVARIDIVDVIDARVPLKKKGREYSACCPFHEEKTPSFTVSVDKQFYHCFGCGAHGTVIGFLMEYERLGFPEAIEELAGRAGMEIPRAASAGARPGTDNIPAILDVLATAAAWYRRQLREHPRAGQATEYLKARGLSGEIAAQYGLGFAPPGWDNLLRALGTDDPTRRLLTTAGLLAKGEKGHYDRLRERVVFPIHDQRGRVVGFGGRLLGDGEPKYLNSPETPVFHKGRELYGLHHAREAIRSEQRVLIVEGYMDVVALAQFGLRNVVATLGTATTRYHLERIFRTAPEAVFCFDGDRAGRQAAWRALETALANLGEGRQVSFLFLPDGQDPDSLVRTAGADALRQRFADATPLPDYFFDHLRAQVDLSRLDGRARLAELARPLLGHLPDGILRRLMTERLAGLTGLPAKELDGLITAPAAPARRRARRVNLTPKRDSLVGDAIAKLLQHPALAAGAEFDTREAIASDLPGMQLLGELLDCLRNHPEMNTAGLLEHFRDHRHHAHLEKLATRRHMVPAESLIAEFRDALIRLRIQLLKRTAERLTRSDRDEDRRRLPELYRQQQALQLQLTKP